MRKAVDARRESATIDRLGMRRNFHGERAVKYPAFNKFGLPKFWTSPLRWVSVAVAVLDRGLHEADRPFFVLERIERVRGI